MNELKGIFELFEEKEKEESNKTRLKKLNEMIIVIDNIFEKKYDKDRENKEIIDTLNYYGFYFADDEDKNYFENNLRLGLILLYYFYFKVEKKELSDIDFQNDENDKYAIDLLNKKLGYDLDFFIYEKF